MEKSSGATPTGCYKCGRPGHWSRDCPSSATNPNSNLHSSHSSSFKSNFAPKPIVKASEKPKKVPRTRPKLTPELLLSDDGLGYILRYFPRSFKYRGRGHEARDLGNLIRLYTQWHSHLLPYYSFDQFVRKVEQVGTTRLVRTCIRELRERVDKGGDPSKLHEPPVEQDGANCVPVAGQATDVEGLGLHTGDPVFDNHEADYRQEDMVSEIYMKDTEEPFQSSHSERIIVEAVPNDQISVKEPLDHLSDSEASGANEIQISEEQRARMEANRLKALHRAAARSASFQAA